VKSITIIALRSLLPVKYSTKYFFILDETPRLSYVRKRSSVKKQIVVALLRKRQSKIGFLLTPFVPVRAFEPGAYTVTHLKKKRQYYFCITFMHDLN